MSQTQSLQCVVAKSALFTGSNHLFRGSEHGVPISFFWDEYTRGQGPTLHRHPYEELHIVEEGKVIFTLGESKIEVEGGSVVIVPKNTPHKFVNPGGEPIKMISIQCSGKMISERLG
jgi:mannose-6-phosphate isomerase-like protein (cupin superfamily)